MNTGNENVSFVDIAKSVLRITDSGDKASKQARETSAAKQLISDAARAIELIGEERHSREDYPLSQPRVEDAIETLEYLTDIYQEASNRYHNGTSPFSATIEIDMAKWADQQVKDLVRATQILKQERSK